MLTLAMGLLLAAAPAPACRIDARAGNARAAATAVNAFGLELYTHLPPGNAVFSPVSLAVALDLASAGARGDTLAGMQQALHLGVGDVHADSAALLHRLEAFDRSGAVLELGARLWLRSSLSPSPEVVRLACSRNALMRSFWRSNSWRPL